MKKLSFLALFLSIFVGKANSQLLWEISGKNIKTSYIFGSFHTAPSSFLSSVKGVFKAFKSSDMVVGEILLQRERNDQNFESYILMPPEFSYSTLLSPEEYQMVDSALSADIQVFTSLEDLSRFKPAVITLMYSNAIAQKAIDWNEIEGNTESDARYPEEELNKQLNIDSYFQHTAVELNKKVKALETEEQQLEVMFGSQTIERQIRILVETVRSSKTHKQQAQKMAKWYFEQKIDSLLSMATQQTSEAYFNAEELEKLIFERNADWAIKIPKILEEGSAFIVVGAAHLAGKRGVINLLKKEGYRVKPVE